MTQLKWLHFFTRIYSVSLVPALVITFYFSLPCYIDNQRRTLIVHKRKTGLLVNGLLLPLSK